MTSKKREIASAAHRYRLTLVAVDRLLRGIVESPYENKLAPSDFHRFEAARELIHETLEETTNGR